MDKISQTIEISLDLTCKEFQRHPTHFFTENDIVCHFYHVLANQLGEFLVKDIDGFEHKIVHAEYPTPFRCDMGGTKFILKSENDRTPRGHKFERGHYDIVVLNPDFIRNHSFNVIKAQDLASYQNEVLEKMAGPIVLFGIEFMYQRDPLKYSRGPDNIKTINEFIAKIIQDADKLLASKEYGGFMKQIKMVTFIKGCPEGIRDILKNKTSHRGEIQLCFT